MSYLKEAKNIGHMLQLSCNQWKSKTSHLVPNKGNFDPVSFEQLWKIVEQYAAAIHAMGIQRGDFICIYSENSFQWGLIDWACQTMGVVVVPIYPTLPGDQAEFIIKNCGAKHVFCGKDELIQRIAHVGTAKSLISTLDEASKSATLRTAEWEAQITATETDSLATLIYTSGTTGNPKGVMLTHRTIVDMMNIIRAGVPLDEKDTFLSFLPMSHVFERVNGHMLPTAIGATIAYAQSLATIASDMVKVRPTIMATVPRFLDAMRGRIMDSTEKMKPIQKKLFLAALSQGIAAQNGKAAPLRPILDKLVGDKVRARLGGRFRYFFSGGAALPLQTAEFFGAFNIMILQGFGLTETASGMCLNRPEDNDYRTIGTPLAPNQMRLAEDGEILIKGPCVMKGYYNLPEDTAKAIDSDGWFYTGDIGVQMPDGKYKITDRKKDLIILGNGKNVAPQLIEEKLKESSLIAEAVLFGDGMEYVCGLIVPDFEKVKAEVAKSGISTSDPADLIQLDPVKKLIKAEIDRINKTLAPFEMVKKHVLLSTQFTIDGGHLTPSMKVKRRVIKEEFASEIASMMRG
jgi:long-chain acyl-CoA synthetase